MCQFCTEHAEGRRWYLEMKNFSAELLNAPLTGSDRELAGADTRADWRKRFFRQFVLPAAGLRQPSGPAFSGAREPATLAEWQRVHFGQVLPLKDVEQVLELATSITRIPCGCRYLTTGQTNARYCFGLGVDTRGIMGRYPEPFSSLEVLERQEAVRLIRKFDSDGLVHSVWTGITPYVIGVCNCDRDCSAYKAYIENRGRPTFFRAEYVGEADPELCTGCKSCMSQCQFGALFFSHLQAKVSIDPTRCFGCGVCMAACPTNAIRLIPRREHPKAKDIWLQYPA